MKTLFAFLVLCMFAMTSFFGCSKSGTGNSVTAKAKVIDNGEPVVTFKNLQGNTVSLANLKGKVLLVDFWATWCEGCQVEMPSLIELQKQYGDKGFTILGVAMDDEGKSVVEPFVQKTHYKTNAGLAVVNFPIVIGDDDVSTKFGGLLGLPTSFLISREGKIVKKYVGVANKEELEREIQSLL